MTAKRDKTRKARRARGFEHTSGLLRERIRTVGEKRGFAVTRLLTHWHEIAGPDIAPIARPVKVGYGRQGLGATLTVLVSGAQAPLVEMQKERIRERVNACYGYNAIARLRLTQTAPDGFAEGQAGFAPAPRPEHGPEPAQDRRLRRKASEVSGVVRDPHLRAALEALGRTVLERDRTRTGSKDDD